MPSAPQPTAVGGVFTVDLHPGESLGGLVSGRSYLVTVHTGDPWRGWNQRLRADGRVNFLAGREATFRTFRDQFDVSEAFAEGWFREHDLAEYLPRDAPGILGRLGRKEHPEPPRGTTRVAVSGLRPDVHELTGQQVADHLVFAVRHTHHVGRSVLDVPHYFKGSGPGQDTHLIFGSGDFGSKPIGRRTTVRIQGRRLAVTRIELPINFANSNEIGLHGDVKQVEPLDESGQVVLRYNVTLTASTPSTRSPSMIVIQFTTDADAEAFLNFLVPRNEN